jgi:WD40 repeat protein
MIHAGPVYSVAFSPDKKYVVSAGGDAGARIWMWQPGDLIANACAHLPRNLTRAEWEHYIQDAMPYRAVCPNLPVEPEASAIP